MVENGGVPCFWLSVHETVFLVEDRLYFHPLKPPGVRHFTMEVFFQLISFSLRFSYWFLTDSIHLKGRKVCRLKEWCQKDGTTR